MDAGQNDIHEFLYRTTARLLHPINNQFICEETEVHNNGADVTAPRFLEAKIIRNTRHHHHGGGWRHPPRAVALIDDVSPSPGGRELKGGSSVSADRKRTR